MKSQDFNQNSYRIENVEKKLMNIGTVTSPLIFRKKQTDRRGRWPTTQLSSTQDTSKTGFQELFGVQ